ncbi:MAG: lipopolysaccharide transport periplasmic protein LptA [Venatoribacter sp.]
MPLRQILNKTVVLLSLALSFSIQALPEDWNQEVIILSDQAKLERKVNTVIYSGNVVLTQGTLKITSDKLTVIRDNQDQFEKAIAVGNLAHYQQQIEAGDPLTYAEAQSIEYYALQREVLLIGKAKITQESNQMTGERIRYDMAADVVTAGQQEENPSRIRVVIQPKSKVAEGK